MFVHTSSCFKRRTIEWYLRFLKRVFVASEKREIERDFKKLIQNLRLRLSGVLQERGGSDGPRERTGVYSDRRKYAVYPSADPRTGSGDDDGGSSGWRW